MPPTPEITVSPREGPGETLLPRWRENVGACVARDFAAASPDAVTAGARALTVLSWNVWVGRGRLREVVRRIRDGAYESRGIAAAAPLVVLLQEAYRSDASVPPESTPWIPRDRPRDFKPEEDVVEVADELRLNLRYAPSMRNGLHRSDRGNAILSTLPLADAAAFELPFVVQRRVTLGATAGLPGAPGPGLRVCSSHLDPWGALGWDWLGVAGRGVQARGLLEGLDGATGAGLPTVLGADLNSTRGRREPAFRLLVEAGFTAGVPHRDPPWTHTYHLFPRLAIDHLLVRPAHGAPASVLVQRVDEHPRDAGPYVFGSDHHPLLARVELPAVSSRPSAASRPPAELPPRGGLS